MNPSCQNRREKRRLVRRREILDVAQRYFLDHGFADTSMSAIASKCGGSKTTLWSHFPSKEALFGAFVDQRVRAFSDALDEALLTGPTMEAALTRFGRVFLSKILSEEARAIRRLIIAEGHRFPDLARTFYESGPMRTRLRLAHFIATKMEANLLRPGEADLAARQFLSLCEAGCLTDDLMHALDARSVDLEREVASAVEAFMRIWSPGNRGHNLVTLQTSRV